MPPNPQHAPHHRPLSAGTRVTQGDPVFPEQAADGADGVFPDGEPFPESARDKRGKFVYVWWTWGEGNGSHRGPGGSPERCLTPPSRRALLAGGGRCHVPADGGDGGGGPGLLHHGGCRLPLPRPPEVCPHRPRQHPVQHHRWVPGLGTRGDKVGTQVLMVASVSPTQPGALCSGARAGGVTWCVPNLTGCPLRWVPGLGPEGDMVGTQELMVSLLSRLRPCAIHGGIRTGDGGDT